MKAVKNVIIGTRCKSCNMPLCICPIESKGFECEYEDEDVCEFCGNKYCAGSCLEDEDF